MKIKNIIVDFNILLDWNIVKSKCRSLENIQAEIGRSRKRRGTGREKGRRKRGRGGGEEKEEEEWKEKKHWKNMGNCKEKKYICCMFSAPKAEERTKGKIIFEKLMSENQK